MVPRTILQSRQVAPQTLRHLPPALYTSNRIPLLSRQHIQECDHRPFIRAQSSEAIVLEIQQTRFLLNLSASAQKSETGGFRPPLSNQGTLLVGVCGKPGLPELAFRTFESVGGMVDLSAQVSRNEDSDAVAAPCVCLSIVKLAPLDDMRLIVDCQVVATEGEDEDLRS